MGRRVFGWMVAVAVAAGGGAAAPAKAPAAPPAASALAPRPATRPATRPTTATTQPADLSTPKAALRALAGALKSGSEQELAHVVACGNDAERRIVAVMAEY